jgi:hypothetical protein
MPTYPSDRIKWHTLGLVPKTNMEFWHQFEAGVSGAALVGDYSGNARHLTNALNPDPALQFNVTYGQPAWYFNGSTTNPLLWGGSTTIRHYFVLAAHQDAAFNLNRGLMSGLTSGDLLASEATGTKFFDLGLPGFGYKKSDIFYAQNDQQAPMGGKFELVEVAIDGGTILDGVQVGKQRNIAGRIWKGWFVDHMGFSQILTASQRRRVLLYYALRYGVHTVTGSQIPLYFPSADLLSDTEVLRNRTKQRERDWSAVTEDYEYDDSNMDFNQFGDNPPRRWEVRYVHVSKGQSVLFDVFNDTARIANTFYFKDQEGVVWNNVRVDRNGYHNDWPDHKSWNREINFDLVGYNSTGTYEG